MSKHHLDNHDHNHGFHCPERIPASVPDDRFASSFPCPKKIPTPRFSAPTSASPPQSPGRGVL